MCNCGKKRAPQTVGESSRFSAQTIKDASQTRAWNDVHFEYTGLTALSVTGKISGKQYRFTQPGNIQPIDYRDAFSMMTIPVLRKLNN